MRRPTTEHSKCLPVRTSRPPRDSHVCAGSPLHGPFHLCVAPLSAARGFPGHSCQPLGPFLVPHRARAPATSTPPRVMRPHIGIFSSILRRDDKHVVGKEEGGGLDRGESSGREGGDQRRNDENEKGPNARDIPLFLPWSIEHPHHHQPTQAGMYHHHTSLSFTPHTHVVIFTYG